MIKLPRQNLKMKIKKTRNLKRRNFRHANYQIKAVSRRNKTESKIVNQ